MKIEHLRVRNFRCFGPTPELIELSSGLTAFIGVNGAGKTAALDALSRLFGISEAQRRFTKSDFHIPKEEKDIPRERSLFIEALISFPELQDSKQKMSIGIPQFFHHMSSNVDGDLKCRLRLEATWSDNGTGEGIIEAQLWALKSDEEDKGPDSQRVSSVDRGSIQFIYLPATRDGISQISAFLKGRLWRAIEWSEDVKGSVVAAGQMINQQFQSEPPVAAIQDAIEKRWREVKGAGTLATPSFRPVGPDFDEIIKSVRMSFSPDASGNMVDIDRLSDGQRSLFHIAMATAALDMEADLLQNKLTEGFSGSELSIPALTMLAIEEPENCLSPFYLSRIIDQLKELGSRPFAQGLLTSHSASLMGRIAPDDARYFGLQVATNEAKVRKILLPESASEAGKYIREAVRAYPELYFASHVILGEGDSEELIIPAIAESLGFPVDPSFVSVVPLGGRHVNHFWRLLSDLEIPFSTLLDLDYGRNGGGWGRIKYACKQLMDIGIDKSKIFAQPGEKSSEELLHDFDSYDEKDEKLLRQWIGALGSHGVFFSTRLDIDLMMLRAFPSEYRVLDSDAKGPQNNPSAAKSTCLGENGMPELYGEEYDDDFVWYRYLFLGRGKPTTHLRVLASIAPSRLADKAPTPIKALLERVTNSMGLKREPNGSEVVSPDAS